MKNYKFPICWDTEIVDIHVFLNLSKYDFIQGRGKIQSKAMYTSE